MVALATYLRKENNKGDNADPFLAEGYPVKFTRRRGTLATAATAVALLLATTACGGGSGGNTQATPSSSANSSSAAGTPAPLGPQDFPAPSRQNIKLASDGKSFTTVPNFTNFGDSCGRPCNPAIFHSLSTDSGKEQLNLDGWPLEAGPGPDAAGHRLKVVCQKADGPPVSNNAGATSRAWDAIDVPAEWLIPAMRAKYSPNGEAVRGWTSDMWMQNQGMLIDAC
jgi:hypothetical protein